MLPSSANKENRGFTIIEQLIVCVFIGIMATVSVPSILGIYNQFKIKDAQNKLRVALTEAQRQAIRKSTDCLVNFSPSGSNNTIISSSCFLTGDRTLSGIILRHNYSQNKLEFNYRGGSNRLGTMVLQIPNFNYQKCLVISNFIGIMRAGDYERTDTTGKPKAGNCTTSQ